MGRGLVKNAVQPKLEQNAKPAPRITPLDFARVLTQDATYAAFHTAIGNDFHLPMLVFAVTARRADRHHKRQCL
jgi:hypothetical protein